MKDYIGQRFGHGVVQDCIGFREIGKKKIRKYPVLLLICDCGQSYETTTQHLISGKTNSCGCLRRKDLSGNRFGLTVAIKFAGYKSIGKKKTVDKPVWECLCDCGKTHLSLGESLSVGDVVSCGCHKIDFKNHSSQGSKTLSIKRYFQNLRFNAKKRNIDFDITVEQIEDLLEKQNFVCVLSGQPISLVLPTTASLDRINNDLGYHIDNIQWVHRRINYMKNTMSVADFQLWCGYVVAQL